MSIRGDEWKAFAAAVADHIENYTVPQYGDKGNDQASDYTADMHVQQAKRYLARFGRKSMGGKDEQLLDLKKAAHYLQMAHDELKAEK